MKSLVTFNSAQQELVSFENCQQKDLAYFVASYKDENNQVHTIEIPVSQVQGNLPDTLSYKEIREREIDLNQCHIMDNYQECISDTTDLSVNNPPLTTNNSNQSFTKDIILAETMQNLAPPPKSLDEPHIYKSGPRDIKKFSETSSNEYKKQEVSGVMISRFLQNEHKIKVYQEKVYIFNEEKGIYEYYTERDLDRLINMHFGLAIEAQDNLKAYRDAQEYLIKHYDLVVPKNFTLPCHYWTFKNGLYNTNSGKMIKNNGSIFVRNVLQCDYNPEASCPNFEQYVNSITGDDDNLAALIWETIGYLLSCDTSGKAFFVLVGKKDTGKSLFAKIIMNIIGDDAVSHLSAQEFSGKFDVADLNGCHLNVCMDLPDTPLSADAVAKIKAITGNDKIRSDVKYKDAINFYPTARLLFGSNSQIRTNIFDPAFNERMITIPFNYPVPKNKQDFNLLNKLLLEKEGICAKALQYYQRLVKRAYHFTHIDWDGPEVYRIDYNKVIKIFAETHCKYTGNMSDKLSTSDLYPVFSNYCFSQTLDTIELNDFSKRFRDWYRQTYGDIADKRKVKINGQALNGYYGLILVDSDMSSNFNTEKETD